MGNFQDTFKTAKQSFISAFFNLHDSPLRQLVNELRDACSLFSLINNNSLNLSITMSKTQELFIIRIFPVITRNNIVKR